MLPFPTDEELDAIDEEGDVYPDDYSIDDEFLEDEVN